MPRIRTTPHGDDAGPTPETGETTAFEPENGPFEPENEVPAASDPADPATLSARTADALRGNGATAAATLLGLWREILTAKAIAENDVTVLEALAVDPENASPEAASAAAGAARLAVRRHTEALDRLAQRWRAAVDSERLEAFRRDLLDPARAARDAAAAALLPAYSAALAILLPALEAAAVADGMVAFVNAQIYQEQFDAAPLAQVEVHARQLPSRPGAMNWGVEQASLMNMRLPAISIGYHTLAVYWPRAAPPELPAAFTPQGAPVVGQPLTEAPPLLMPADGEAWPTFQRRIEAEQRHELIAADWARRAQGDATRIAEAKAEEAELKEEARQLNAEKGWLP